jgi:hypothetical protein
MSHAVRRQLITAVVTATSLALVAAPAGAATKTDKAQTKAIKKAQKTATSAGKAAKSAGKTAKKAAQDATKGISDAKSAQTGVNGILGQVPQVLDGLAKLAAGLTKAGEGLTALANGYAAQEYGVVKVQVGTTDIDGALLVSGDIPDDGNSATVSGTMIVPVPANTTAQPVRLLAGVRSGESDGTGPTNPVASAGIVTMSVANVSGGAAPPGTLTIGGGNAVATAAPITSKPNTTLKGAPIYPIPLKAPRSDATPNPFGFPTDKAIDLTDASLLYDLGGGVGPYTVTNLAPSPLPITVTVTVRFNDLSATATDTTA